MKAFTIGAGLCAGVLGRSSSAGAATPGFADPGFTSGGPQNVPVAWGEERLIVESAWAQRSGASRASDTRRRWDLSDRVVVQMSDVGTPGARGPVGSLSRATWRAAIGGAAGVRLEPLPGVAGCYVARAGSVEAAIKAAGRARGMGAGAVRHAYVEAVIPRRQRAVPPDPLVAQQWHLRNLVTPAASINVEGAWDAGITGAGVTIGIVDYGASVNHPDLAANYRASASQALPAMQRDEHSTACAGLASAVAFNSVGGAGVALGSTWSNLTYGTGPVDEAIALAFRNDLNFVKSSSWGPDDNGRISYLDPAVKAALAGGVQSGRGGLGTVFVWAAGNGGNIDRVDYDPYASSRYVCAISAVGDLNQVTSYDEAGSCLLGVAPSDGNVRFVTTTSYLGANTYTSSFGGTSAAAPIAAGVAALVLQANPALTWRDVKHVLIASCTQVQAGDEGWTTNGAARAYHERLGFGLIDAARAVKIAQGFAGVGDEAHAGGGVVSVNAPVPDNDLAGLTRSVSISDDLRVEHVEVTLNVAAPSVGQLRIELTSPSGTTGTLAEPRFDPAPGYSGYVFTATRFWGEPGGGTWSVRIADEAAGTLATWTSFSVDVYGHRHCPADVTSVGGAGQNPAPAPDGQLTVDDLVVFVNAFIDASGRADIARVGGGVGPDGEVSVDDLILFVNGMSGGCAG